MPTAQAVLDAFLPNNMAEIIARSDTLICVTDFEFNVLRAREIHGKMSWVETA